MSAISQRKPSRRERLRAETTEEILTIALRQLAADGPGAISLRGIARDMGMTPRAIYSYFATRDELITTLIGGMVDSLADALDAACEAVPGAEPEERLLAWAQALREWASSNPEGFRLVYGHSVPGYQPPADGPVDSATRRMCLGLNRLVASALPAATPYEQGDWSGFTPDYLEKIRADVPDLTPAQATLALRVWSRLHGLVTLEIYGHLQPVFDDPASLYRAEVLTLLDQPSH